MQTVDFCTIKLQSKGTLICVFYNKTVNWAEVNSSWWSGTELNVDVGQYQCDALRLLFSTMPIPQGLPPHHQLGWHGSPPACGRSESSPRCVPMLAVGHTENFSTPTLNSLQPPAQTLHASSGWLLILHRRGKKYAMWFWKRTGRAAVWPCECWILMVKWDGDHEADWLGCAITFCWESQMRRDGCLPPRPRERARDLQAVIKQE